MLKIDIDLEKKLIFFSNFVHEIIDCYTSLIDHHFHAAKMLKIRIKNTCLFFIFNIFRGERSTPAISGTRHNNN